MVTSNICCRKIWFLALLLLVICQFSVQAQDMSFLQGSDRFKVGIDYGRFSSSPNIEKIEGSLVAPIWKAERISLALTGKGQMLRLSDPIYFPSHGSSIPEEFGSAAFGLVASRESLSGDMYTLSGSYGHSGVRLLDSRHRGILSANFSYESKTAASSWIYFINYSNNRALLNNIPIPGVAYLRRSRNSVWVLGLPFLSFSWRSHLFLTNLFASPFGASAEGGIQSSKLVQFFSRISWSPKSYERVVLSTDERLIMDSTVSTTGLKILLSNDAQLSLGYSYAFARRAILGRSLNDSSKESLAISDAGGVELAAKASF
ncbi:MAG: hypothetical protein AB7F86_02100 [Bdellovibrionales bacterium]